MRIDLDDEYKKLCYIQEIKPGKLNMSKIVIGTFLTLLTLGIPALLYWKWQRFKNFIHNAIFQESEKDSELTSHYLIVDSKKFEGKSRNIIFRNSIVSPYLIQQQQILNLYIDQHHTQTSLCKYIEHKNLRYLIKDNTLSSLKFKINKPLLKYFNEGLLPQQIIESLKVFGKSQTFFIAFYDIFRKILHQKRLRLVFILFAVKKIVYGILNPSEQQNSVMISLFILSQIALAFLLMAGISIFGAKQHNTIHDKIQNHVHYEVIRDGQKVEVKLKDLYVGDVIIPKIGQRIYFQGLISAKVDSQDFEPYAIVNEKLFNRYDKPIRKIPLLSHLNQTSSASIINPGTIILNMSIKKRQLQSKKSIDANKRNSAKRLSQLNQNIRQVPQTIPQHQFYIIVMDNNFMQKFNRSFKDSCYFDNFQSIRKSYDSQQVIFEAIFLVLSIIGVILATIGEQVKQHWIDLLLSLIILCFPFNIALFSTISEILSIVRLHKKQITVVNPSIQEIAIADQISLELSAFQTDQFSGFIKKQNCARMALPQKFQSSTRLFDIFRKAKQESIFTFLGWIGMMNLPYLQTEPMLRQIFEKYDFTLKQKSQYDDEQELNLRVQNNETSSIKIDWKEIQRFPISEKLIQSVVVEDLYISRFENKCFVILQGEYTSEECQDYFDEIVDEVGRDQYKQMMKKLFLNGKKVKYISLKRLNIDDQKSLNHFKRKESETKALFGGFLVFDQWPTQQGMKALVKIDTLELQNMNSGINVTIFSVRQENALVGYNHVLRKSNILYQQKSQQRTQEIYLVKSQFEGILFVGNGILDRGSLLVADVSINMISQSYAQADFQTSKPESTLDLLYQGIWLLYNSTLTIVCLVMFNFSKIVGQLVIFQNDANNNVQTQPLAADIDKLFIIDVGALIVPILLLNVYQPTEKLVRKHQRTFFRIDLMFHVLISIVGLLVLYTIEFLDHGFQGLCNQQGQNLNHHFTLRSYSTHDFFQPRKSHSCEGIIDFTNISFAFFVILLIDRQSEERKARNFIVGMLNKFYMAVLWIGSIFYFHIPLKNVLRSIIVIIVLTTLVYVFDFVRKKKINKEQMQTKNEEKKSNEESQLEEQR